MAPTHRISIGPNAFGCVLRRRLPMHPQAHVQRTKRWGVAGETEIRGEAAGREIVLEVTLCDNHATQQALDEAIGLLDELTGGHGTLLIEDLNNPQLGGVYEFVTFMGFEPDPSPEAGPFEDTTGLLGGWWRDGVLKFYQLRIARGGGGFNIFGAAT